MIKNKMKNEFKDLSLQDLDVKIEGLRRDLFSMRLHSVTSQVKDYKQYSKFRKAIARGLTYYNQKKNS